MAAAPSGRTRGCGRRAAQLSCRVGPKPPRAETGQDARGPAAGPAPTPRAGAGRGPRGGSEDSGLDLGEARSTNAGSNQHLVPVFAPWPHALTILGFLGSPGVPPKISGNRTGPNATEPAAKRPGALEGERPPSSRRQDVRAGGGTSPRPPSRGHP